MKEANASKLFRVVALDVQSSRAPDNNIAADDEAAYIRFIANYVKCWKDVTQPSHFYTCVVGGCRELSPPT